VNPADTFIGAMRKDSRVIHDDDKNQMMAVMSMAAGVVTGLAIPDSRSGCCRDQ
jgi:hypothetical protein